MDHRDLELTNEQFVRAIQVNRTSPHILVLGAGASVSSGIPSASSCIWDWKRRLYQTHNPGLADLIDELSSVGSRQRIQTWLDAQGTYPQEGDKSEYAHYAELCFPVASDRRRYFQELVEGVRPHIGYRMACFLAEAGIIQSVWTTNFDSLFVKAAADFNITVIEVGLDTTQRIERQPAAGEVLHVAIHGDYRYDALRNTAEELRKQDERLRQVLVTTLQTVNLIIVGYSGRDNSVMETFKEAYGQPGPGRLYWCGLADSLPADHVQVILETAKASGREAFFVPIHGFDDLLTRMADHCLEEPQRSDARSIWGSLRERDTITPFSLPRGIASDVVKSNAFPLTPPVDLLELEIADGQGRGLWSRLRQRTEGRPVVAGVYRGRIVAFGDPADVTECVGDLTSGELRRTPLRATECGHAVLASLIAEVIVRGLAERARLETDGRRYVWRCESHRAETVDGVSLNVHLAANLRVRKYADSLYLVIEPTVVACSSLGERVIGAKEKEVRRRLLARQYNKEFNQDVNTWMKLLLPMKQTEISFPHDGKNPFLFRIQRTPLFAGIVHDHHQRRRSLPEKVLKVVTQTGIRYSEPELMFSNTDGTTAVPDSHPIRGILNNMPFDYRLTTFGHEPNIKMGVVCPKGDESPLRDYLEKLDRIIDPSSKQEYLLPYPGFTQAFGIPLDIPEPNSSRWVTIAGPSNGMSPDAGSREMARSIVDGVDRLISANQPHVVCIFVPRRWRIWEQYDSGFEKFDVHDFTKAHCVQRGIATQFLREETFGKKHQCEIRWWIALALYAKSMRIPWVLRASDSETAFLGLGFSVKPKTGRNGHVILGCSHIYNADGVGLRYRLSRLEGSFVRGYNPFMSYNDARRMAESARQLFSERGRSLPRRIVVHRRSPFRKEEIRGIRDGFGGIPEIDMLEVNVEPTLKYIAAKVNWRGSVTEDAFPVARGTAVMIDERRFLLWAHGSVPALDPKRRYYKGATRIPAPLIVTRYAGSSSIGTTANELLGLSKMNWNSFDMYSQLPATIESSNAIARIGGLLQRFGESSYDYRLFI